MKRILLILAVAGVVVGGCTAISKLPALQPPAVPKSPPVHVGAAQLTQPLAPVFQRGVDIDAYTYPGQDIAAAARADVAYIKSLHANAVSISFPFFTAGPRVYATRATPTPSQIAVIAGAARRAGLIVSVRPLLDEGNLGKSRVGWKPVDRGAWFRSYTRFLGPYAVVAQQQGVHMFIVGTELSAFRRGPRWVGLDRAVRREFHGTLAYADNWSDRVFTGNGGPVIDTVDAYPPSRGPVGVGWRLFDGFLPRGAIITEVGISAVDGAFRKPWVHTWPAAVLDPQVQARWFTAACKAAAAERLGGIYFWSIGLSDHPDIAPTLASQGAWGGAGARAISRCFARIERGGK